MTTEMYKTIQTIIFALGILPFLPEVLAFSIILRYMSHAINIAKTTNEFFRAIKLRYTNSAKLNISIKNPESFIEKILLGKDGPLKKLITIDHFCLMLVSFNLACMTIFAIKGHTDFTYIIAIMSLCFYLFRQACAIEQKAHLIISLTADYLENTLYHRVNPVREAEEKHQNVTNKSTENKQKEATADSSSSATSKQEYTTETLSTSKKDNSDIIEAVLQEFLA